MKLAALIILTIVSLSAASDLSGTYEGSTSVLGIAVSGEVTIMSVDLLNFFV